MNLKRKIGQNDRLNSQAEDYYYNLHCIAISNLDDPSKRIERWWKKKYRTPLRAFDEHTHEELSIEMIEDFYEKHPEEKERFWVGLDAAEEEWQGETSEEYERQMQERLKKLGVKNRVDLTRFKSEKLLSEDEEEKLLANVGRNLPGSKKVVDQSPSLGEGEFEEEF
jgi:hypothetical protein